MIYKNKFSFISGLYDIFSRMTDKIPILTRCITSHKVTYAEYLLESLYPDERNTDALVEIRCDKNICTAHYIHIDENGNKSLKTQVYEDGDMKDIIKRFGIVLLAIRE